RRSELVKVAARAGGLTELGRPLSALVLGSGAGELCRQLDDWGATVLGLETDPQQLTIARTFESYLRDGRIRYLDTDPVAYLAREEGAHDLTYVGRAALSELAELRPRERERALDALAARTEGICLLELDAGTDT